MTSLSKNVKPHFVSNPADLLETKSTLILDARSFIDGYKQWADTLFQAPERGAYLPGETKPLFTPYDVLYTHRDTHEYFPEIGETVVNTVGTVLEAQRRGRMVPIHVRQTVGDRIDWRDAVEKQINVYSREGRLLISSTRNRATMHMLFNPGPTLFANRFIADLANIMMLEATCWGDSTQVKAQMREYLNESVCIEACTREAIEMFGDFYREIVAYVKQDPWAIYRINALGTSLLIEKSCDYRHFKCNEMLLERLRKEEPDNDIVQAFSPGQLRPPRVRYEDLDSLYHKLFSATGHRVESIPELFELLSKTKNNQQMTSQVLLVFEDYVSDANNKSSLASELVGKLTSRSFINKVLEKQNGISSSDFNVGAGIYIL